MRRETASLVAVIGIALTVLALHALVDAQGGEGAALRPRTLTSFISPISPIDPPGVISGLVFDDVNGDGLQDAGESGIAGVTVELRNGVSDVVTTPADGRYSFDVGKSGIYTVTATTPTGYMATTPEESVVGITGPAQSVTVDFGYRGIGTILGVVFEDLDGDGAQDGGELGIGGVTITLLQGSSTISSTMTAVNGSYGFAPLFSGDYTVRETDPEGYASTTPNEVSVSLTVPGEKSVSFGDRRSIFLPIVSNNYP